MSRLQNGEPKKSGAQKSRDFETRQKDRGRVQKHLWVHGTYAKLLELYAAECRAREERGEPPPAEPPEIKARLSADQIGQIQMLFDGKAATLLKRFAAVLEQADPDLLERLDTRLAIFEDQLRPVAQR